jgi:putative nucleotidyltransferase with HDIG domain
MSVRPALSTVATLYVSVVACLGAAVVAGSLGQLIVHATYLRQWAILAALTVASGTAVLKMPAIPVSFSISDAFTITAAILFGPAAGTVTVALDALAMSYRLSRAHLPVRRVIFNATAPALAMWVAAHVFFLLAGVAPLSQARTEGWRLILPLAAFAALYFALNTGSIATAIALEQRRSPLAVWRGHFVGLWLAYFGGALAAGLVVLLVYRPTSDLTILAVILPLPIILYFAFKNATGRMEDQIKHLAEVNRLHLSMIDALAHAIDAKDQVTHGHLRRVQVFAVRLARELGVTDENELKAIEAAALLHDMGKLGVPEHILNKPGRLTRTEFDKMKLHATIGADILSSIQFPYPVVPIVRHHHEHWDGTGYPAGLRGGEIPIGARILSVVDGFDALTSDRPYRPRLSDEDALRILRASRGSKYDPLVVDTLATLYRDAALPERESAVPSDALTAITRALQPSPDVPAGAIHRIDLDEAEVMLAFFNLGGGLIDKTDLAGIGGLVWTALERVVPASSCAVFLYDSARDELRAAFSAGEHAGVLGALEIPVGQRLTGWVAANRATIVNSDAALDLGSAGDALKPPLVSSLSTPLLAGQRLVGVLTLYSTSREPFTDRHGRILQVMAQVLSRAVGSAEAQAAPQAAATAPQSTQPASKARGQLPLWV